MHNDSEQLNDILQSGYHSITDYYTYTELPENVIFEMDGDDLKIKYKSDIVTDHLNNYNSFEGWCIVCLKWGGFDNIIFDWEPPKDKTAHEYYEFIYRVNHFKSNFPSWFSLSKDAEKHLKDLTIPPDIYLCDKLVVESIIEISWFFEMGEKINIDIPPQFDIKLNGGVAEIKNHESDLDKEEDKNQEPIVYTPWELLIQRWAFISTSPFDKENSLSFKDALPDNIEKLIKVGFTERSLPFEES